MGKEFNCIVYLFPFTRCVVLYQLENVAPLSAQQSQWHDPLQGVAKLSQTQLPRIDEYKWDSFSSLHAPLAEGLLKCRKVEWNLVACEHMCFEHFPIFLWDHGNCFNVQVCHWGFELAKRPIKKPTEQIWRLTANKKFISNHICCCPRSMLIAMVTVTMTKNTKCQARCNFDNTTNWTETQARIP